MICKLKAIATWLALILLFLSSAVAFYSGYQLYAHPDGSSVKLPLEILENTPFKNFKIPGIALIISIGLFGAVTIIFTLYQQQYHAKYIIGAGFMLTVWILILMAVSPEVYRKYYVLLFMGIIQLLCGLYIDRRKQEDS